MANVAEAVALILDKLAEISVQRATLVAVTGIDGCGVNRSRPYGEYIFCN